MIPHPPYSREGTSHEAAHEIADQAASRGALEKQARFATWFGEYVATGCESGWAPVKGYEGFYEISIIGDVRSLWVRNGSTSAPRIRPIRTSPVGGGYLGWTAVGMNGRRNTVMVHTAVLAAFSGDRPAGTVGGHRNGNKFDNRLSNLSWITYKENEADKRRHNRHLSGSRNHQAKLKEAAVKQMRLLRAAGQSYYRLARTFGVSAVTAQRACDGVTWRDVQ